MTQFGRSRWIGLGIIILALGLGGWMLHPVFAQYVEPSGLPPGGRSASYLDTSINTQQKLGSLLIGDNAGNGELCLNGDAGADCIQDWAELGSGLSGNFVRLYPDQVGNPNQPSSYDPFIEPGSAILQGNGSSAVPTIIADTFAPDAMNPGNLGTYTGVFATDARDATNYAARFAGRLTITDHDNGAGPGQLCLNATTVYNPADPTPHYGCITAWSQIDVPPTPTYVKLQFVNPPVYQLGAGWIGTGSGVIRGAFQVRSAIAGGVTDYGPASAVFFNDELCSPEIGEISFGSPDCI